jgi:hypothetical protein
VATHRRRQHTRTDGRTGKQVAVREHAVNGPGYVHPSVPIDETTMRGSLLAEPMAVSGPLTDPVDMPANATSLPLVTDGQRHVDPQVRAATDYLMRRINLTSGAGGDNGHMAGHDCDDGWESDRSWGRFQTVDEILEAAAPIEGVPVGSVFVIKMNQSQDHLGLVESAGIRSRTFRETMFRELSDRVGHSDGLLYPGRNTTSDDNTADVAVTDLLNDVEQRLPDPSAFRDGDEKVTRTNSGEAGVDLPVIPVKAGGKRAVTREKTTLSAMSQDQQSSPPARIAARAEAFWDQTGTPLVVMLQDEQDHPREFVNHLYDAVDHARGRNVPMIVVMHTPHGHPDEPAEFVNAPRNYLRRVKFHPLTEDAVLSGIPATYTPGDGPTVDPTSLFSIANWSNGNQRAADILAYAHRHEVSLSNAEANPATPKSALPDPAAMQVPNEQRSNVEAMALLMMKQQHMFRDAYDEVRSAAGGSPRRAQVYWAVVCDLDQRQQALRRAAPSAGSLLRHERCRDVFRPELIARRLTRQTGGQRPVHAEEVEDALRELSAAGAVERHSVIDSAGVEQSVHVVATPYLSLHDSSNDQIITRYASPDLIASMVGR